MILIRTVTSIHIVQPGEKIRPWRYWLRRFIKGADKVNGRITLIPRQHVAAIEAFSDEAWAELMAKEEAHRQEHRQRAEAEAQRNKGPRRTIPGGRR